MTPEIIQMIAQFMSRVNLQAAEIDAYQTCMQVLGQEMQRLTQGENENPQQDTGGEGEN